MFFILLSLMIFFTVNLVALYLALLIIYLVCLILSKSLGSFIKSDVVLIAFFLFIEVYGLFTV